MFNFAVRHPVAFVRQLRFTADPSIVYETLVITTYIMWLKTADGRFRPSYLTICRS
jgi:hypothetical protein